jgi:chitin disaccharide deacetylase
MKFMANNIFTMKTGYTLLLVLICSIVQAQEATTFAEKLGFPKGAKVLILHVDDIGMSWDSNEGALQAINNGVATSVSMMMPCPWIPGFFHYLASHPETDAGLHLTLTSEWKDYRWGPLSGKKTTPGLVDSEGAFWSSVQDVVKNATADEVELEIRAQIDRAKTMNFEPTHLDSHMGTLFASPAFLERYIKIGIEYKIPLMFPAGHNTMIGERFPPDLKSQFQQTGLLLWNAGLPVLDDLHSASYDFTYPKEQKISDAELQKIATSQYIRTIKALKPGLTMVIMHCSTPSPIFQYITDSGTIRKADLLAMQDPTFKKFLQEENIILTTWRELAKRRKEVK